jgi:hypothetical protein
VTGAGGIGNKGTDGCLILGTTGVSSGSFSDESDEK